MAKQITFAEFSKQVSEGAIDLKTLGNYVEQDSDSRIPKLRLKIDALSDEAPEDYDVDIEIYKMMRAAQSQKRIERFGIDSKPDVVAEGDSWFQHFVIPGFFPTAIATRIDWNGSVNMENIAYWGHTITRISRAREYMSYIDANDTEYFMLSGGGNDIQDGIVAFVHEYDPQRPLDDYLTQEGKKCMVNIGSCYEEVLSEVKATFPKVKILCHGYDYPRPGNGTKYIGKYFQAKGIPESKMTAVMNPIIDKLNDVIKVEAAKVSATYLNMRGKTQGYVWYDDMHPDSDAFKVLAKVFEDKMFV